MPRLASPHHTLRGGTAPSAPAKIPALLHTLPQPLCAACLAAPSSRLGYLAGSARAFPDALCTAPTTPTKRRRKEQQGPRSAARSRPPPDLRARSSGRDQASVMRVVIWPEVDDGGHQGGIRPLPLAIIIDELRGVAFTRQSVMAWSPSREVVHTCVLSAHTPETGPSALSTCRGSPRSSERTCTR